MRNKRLIAIFSILLAVTLVVLLSSIIFSVKTINTRCLNSPVSDQIIDSQILSSISDIKGRNIFLVNEKKAIDKIHQEVPSVRVINLEGKAPNRMTVHYVRLFDYFQLASGGLYYPLTFEGRVIAELDEKAKQKIDIISNHTGQMQVGDYLYHDQNRQILKEIVASLEQMDLAETGATERFRMIDLEAENDCLYIGLVDSPIMIKINRVSELDKLAGKIRLGYSVYLSDKFDRNPDQNGRFKMINVVNPASAMDPLCDYTRA